jgi:hypothetical protein
MSIKIGTVDPTSAIPEHAPAAVGTSAQDRQINVYVSEAGVEIYAAPCVLSLAQACALRGVLDEAIAVAARHKKPS